MMKPLRVFLPLVVLAIFLLQVSAGHPIENVILIPDAESLPAGMPVNLSATIRIVPPGPTTTFIEWDELVISTELENPRWDVVAVADQHSVTVKPAEGPVVRVPGYLLSFSPGRQVSVNVSVEGTVPQPQEARSVVVLSVDEQNDRGVSVYGPAGVISRAVVPSPQAPPVSTTQPPTTVAASFVPVLFALAGTLVVFWRRAH